MYVPNAARRDANVARKTKQEALATRDAILDAAEQLFREHGVSRTSLQDIAAAAGLTRGAIYWHFQDKGDLFNAMMERATAPLEEQLAEGFVEGNADPLAHVHALAMAPLQLAASDARTRTVFDIAMHKVEYVDELIAARDRHLAVYDRCLPSMEQALKAAIDQGRLSRELAPRASAIGMWAIVDGLLRVWLLNPQAFDLVAVGEHVVGVYLSGLGPAGQSAA